MSFEQSINQQLNKHPKLKVALKRVYQRLMYTISPKVKSEGNITRISPNDLKHEYFFGYYDKTPWSANDRYMLCMRARDTWSDVSPKEKAEILLIDTSLPENDKNRVRKIAETKSWNVQQGCMLQWLGPDFSSKIIFNDYRDGRYVSVIKEIENGNERVIDSPVYTVSSDGKMALSLDFSRLYSLRPGYGYYNEVEKTIGEDLPDGTAVWKINLESGEVSHLMSYKDFASFQPRSEMQERGSVHKVNHLMLSPSGKRCMVLYRWFVGRRKYTRLITFNTVDGSDMYVLSDDDMVSHCFWKDERHILGFENKKEGGPGYYLMTDKTQEFIHCWPQINNDGHPSYSFDGSCIVTDSYPDRARISEIKLMSGMDEKSDKVRVIARVFAPFKYDNDSRCDLHPRWNHLGNQICFDSVFEGHRGLYTVEIPKQNNEYQTIDQSIKVSCVIPSYKRCDTVTRAIDSVLAQTYKNIEVCLVDDNFPGDEYSRKLQDALTKYAGDDRVRYITQEKHINGAAARNAGIRAATGEYIGFLDDDDEWLPEKVEKQMAFLQSNPTVDACTVLWRIFRNGKLVRKCAPYTPDNLQFKILLRDVAVFTSTVFIKKKAIDCFRAFDERLSRHQDIQFLVDALGNSKFGVLQEYLVNLHADSEINKPNTEKFIKAKSELFKSVQNELNNYCRSERIRIRNAHYYEIVFVAIKSKNYGIAIKYILKAGINPASIHDFFKRFKERKQL